MLILTHRDVKASFPTVKRPLLTARLTETGRETDKAASNTPTQHNTAQADTSRTQHTMFNSKTNYSMTWNTINKIYRAMHDIKM